MGALCDPIFDITITCPACGMQISKYGDLVDVWYEAFEEYIEHLEIHREETEL